MKVIELIADPHLRWGRWLIEEEKVVSGRG